MERTGKQQFCYFPYTFVRPQCSGFHVFKICSMLANTSATFWGFPLYSEY